MNLQVPTPSATLPGIHNESLVGNPTIEFMNPAEPVVAGTEDQVCISQQEIDFRLRKDTPFNPTSVQPLFIVKNFLRLIYTFMIGKKRMKLT